MDSLEKQGNIIPFSTNAVQHTELGGDVYESIGLICQIDLFHLPEDEKN